MHGQVIDKLSLTGLVNFFYKGRSLFQINVKIVLTNVLHVVFAIISCTREIFITCHFHVLFI